MARDYPKPNVEDTDPYREANALSSRFCNDLKVHSTVLLMTLDQSSHHLFQYLPCLRRDV